MIGVPDEEMGEQVKAVVQPAPGAEPGRGARAELIELRAATASRASRRRAASTSSTSCRARRRASWSRASSATATARPPHPSPGERPAPVRRPEHAEEWHEHTGRQDPANVRGEPRDRSGDRASGGPRRRQRRPCWPRPASPHPRLPGTVHTAAAPDRGGRRTSGRRRRRRAPGRGRPARGRHRGRTVRRPGRGRQQRQRPRPEPDARHRDEGLRPDAGHQRPRHVPAQQGRHPVPGGERPRAHPELSPRSTCARSGRARTWPTRWPSTG